MLKKTDYIIITIIFFFLGIFIVSQYYSSREYSRVVQPQNNEIIALEVAGLTKNNANLRREVQDLTADLSIYQHSSETSKGAYDKYQSDLVRFSIINGAASASGQGIIIKISGKLTTPQIVDLLNAIKNIGSEVISLNGMRITLSTEASRFNGLDHYEILVLGNSKLLKSAIERRGGIVDQISEKDIKIEISESDNLEISSGIPLGLKYAKIVKEE